MTDRKLFKDLKSHGKDLDIVMIDPNGFAVGNHSRYCFEDNMVYDVDKGGNWYSMDRKNMEDDFWSYIIIGPIPDDVRGRSSREL